ncbi:MAG: hypothetical protein QOD93_2793 [Acetobacteraceae bacterium]|jgi:hypothetical protein|nr:hypothetical protein [Acetobacteraceae bacterium]MEA2769831.1 hypothetical protein [Acetobacteraceae bacterium]
MTICFMPYVHDANLDIWTFPPAARADPDAFELSVSSANGADLLLAMGLAPEPDGLMPIDAFGGLLSAALRRHLDQRSPELPVCEDAQPGKITLIYLGRPEGYIEQRLGELMRMVQTCRAAGATHFGWG